MTATTWAPAQTGAGTGPAESIYQRALGAEFSRLHPQIQRRFGLTSASGYAAIGTGLMETIWRGGPHTVPFLCLGTRRRIMFPERGTDVPFRIENYAYRDPLGRETVTWLRRFQTRPARRFDAYMVFSERRGRVVDYLGTHQHLAVDLELSVDTRGGLLLRSGEQRFYEGPLGFRFPLTCSGVATVNEWFEETEQRFRIEVSVSNRLWGPVFGYRGYFSVEWVPVGPGAVPADVLPRRVEVRD